MQQIFHTGMHESEPKQEIMLDSDEMHEQRVDFLKPHLHQIIQQVLQVGGIL